MSFIQMESTRIAYGQALLELANEFEFVVMDADLSKATQTCEFATKFSGRFFNFGISEGDMYASAAGFASCGIPVIASTFAIFAAGRAYEPIRQLIGYTGLNVKIAATHAGVLIGEDGGSHQAIEDIALMRVIPGMTVLAPSDAISTKQIVRLALEKKGPVYMRFGRYPSPIIYDKNDTNFKIGSSRLLRDGKDAAVIAIGDMVSKAIEAADILSNEGISVKVIDMYSIKPLDGKAINEAASTGRIVTAEDHSIIGGLGGAVAEYIVKNCPVPMRTIGIEDMFGCSGSPNELAEKYNLTSTAIVAAIKNML